MGIFLISSSYNDAIQCTNGLINSEEMRSVEIVTWSKQNIVKMWHEQRWQKQEYGGASSGSRASNKYWRHKIPFDYISKSGWHIFNFNLNLIRNTFFIESVWMIWHWRWVGAAAKYLVGVYHAMLNNSNERCTRLYITSNHFGITRAEGVLEIK